MSLLSGDMVVYVENSKESTKKFLALISNYSKVAECIKSIAFLSISNEKVEFKIKKPQYYVH